MLHTQRLRLFSLCSDAWFDFVEVLISLFLIKQTVTNMVSITGNRIQSASIRNPKVTDYIQRMSADVFGINASLLSDRSQWRRKCDVKHCHVCFVKFSLWTLKHHCRSCGNIACSACSSRRVCFHSKTVRVCDDCVTTKLVRPSHVTSNANLNGQHYPKMHSRLHPSLRRHSIAIPVKESTNIDQFVASLQLHAPVKQRSLPITSKICTNNEFRARRSMPMERIRYIEGDDTPSIAFGSAVVSQVSTPSLNIESMCGFGHWDSCVIKVFVVMLILVATVASV